MGDINLTDSTTHIAILASPGMGHLIPLAELARCLLRHYHHKLTITFIAQSTCHFTAAEQAVIDSLPKTQQFNLIVLPPVPLDIIPDAHGALNVVFNTLQNNYPKIQEKLKFLATKSSTMAEPIVALVVDLLMVQIFKLAREINVAPYLMYTSNCMSLSFSFHLPELDQEFKGAYKDLPEPLRLPGCVPINGRDFMEPVHFRGTPLYDYFLSHVKLYRDAKGVMVNTFNELEPDVLAVLNDDKTLPAIYSIGPLVRSGEREAPGSHHADQYCMEWLNRQLPQSVIYVSFGSGGGLTAKQMNELAQGLEMSGQRFLWVVKKPKQIESNESPLEFLPQGFLERMKDFGLVIPSWAPQAKVLAHKSTAGFISHCGWNSVLESVVNGVPLIAWPLYAEQHMNATLLIDGLKIALRPRAGVVDDGDEELVEREEVERVVRCLMEGEAGKKVRERAKELKLLAAAAHKEEGTSLRSVAALVNEWESLKMI